MKALMGLCIILSALLLTGCAKPVGYDYTAFKQSRPKSILVLPPLNQSTDVKASYSMLSQVTYPLAEAGYYVLPVAVVDETFRQNGLTTPADIHSVSPAKLQQIFGADAVLYLNVKEYGTQYMVIASDTRVTADAKLVDLRTGAVLWAGTATASSNEGQASGAGVIGILVQAVVDQVANTMMERGHNIAGITSVRLLSAERYNGMLHGPRSPKYGKDVL